jgi:hypothetical protein
MGERAIVIGNRRLGVELDRLAEIGDGAIVVAFVDIGLAAVGIGQRKFGTAFLPLGDDLRAGGDGALDIVPAAFGPVFAGGGIGRARKCDEAREKKADHPH